MSDGNKSAMNCRFYTGIFHVTAARNR